MLIANFNGNPITAIISCYSPTCVSDIKDVEKFYESLSSLVRLVPKWGTGNGSCLVERDIQRESRSPNGGIKFVRTSNAGPSLITVQCEWVKIEIDD